jgi:hypothetical protein
MGVEAMTAIPLTAFIEVDVRLLTPGQGGRRSGIWSGYRCNCWIGHVGEDGERSYNDATFYLLDVAALTPGAAARARVQPHDPDEWADVGVGTTFELCEGPRVVGEAVIMDLFPTP